MCYALAHETLAHDMSFVYFSLFDPKKVHFEAKIDSFLFFIPINFLVIGLTPLIALIYVCILVWSPPRCRIMSLCLVWTLKYTEICICFSHENMINPPRNVGYFGKIAEIFSTAQTAQTTNIHY